MDIAKAERIDFNSYFERFFRKEVEAEKCNKFIKSSVKYKLEEALNDESVFETLDHDYEIVQAYKSNVMRALRNLDGAIKGDQISRDAVFTALSQMQDNIKQILRNEAEKEYNNRMT